MKSSFSILLAISLLLPAFSSWAQTITKCQDAEGNWHYGNYASQECDAGAITELRESGVILEVHEPPPTMEEIRARQAREQTERDAQIAREEKLRIDRTLKEKYASEDVIVGLREQRILELEKQIAFNEAQLTKLRTEQAALSEPASEYEKQEVHELAQLIGRFERAVERARIAIRQTQSDYEKLLERYRQIDLPE